MSKARDVILAIVFSVGTLAFILLMMFSPTFFDWMWARHHNVWSWYIRPLLLLPFCFFAWKKSFGGMAFSIFAMATSMGWFPPPQNPDPHVTAFLQSEYAYLYGDITTFTVLGWIAVLVTYLFMGIACFMRNIRLAMLIVIAAATLKIIWSRLEGGTSGWAILPAALIGALICVLLLWVMGKYAAKNKHM
ncbi:hypothetical protein [Desulfovibrio inopinatus]|uniref:hypothetical protein n=1 Tax=Desulfovibrio inopinatus TaxID=102109 RepID=UPI00041A2BE6|nr:hypothetical protein [Desulfovibrio inopinatus]